MLRLINILSLDVAIGTVGLSVLIANILGESTPSVVFACLGCSVWIIYTLDHILDALSLREKAVTQRHKFHYKYRKAIIMVLALVGLFNLYLIRELPAFIFYGGLVASVLVAVHLLLVKYRGNRVSWINQKEFGVAGIFVIGVMMPSLEKLFQSPLDFMLLFFSVFFLALYNLFLFSFYQYTSDTRQDDVSIARILGLKVLKRVNLGLSAMSFLAIFISASSIGFSQYFMILMLIWALHFLVHIAPGYFASRDYYRMTADGAFLSSWLTLLVSA